MSIYGISDLHLSFGVNKPMNIFGKIWDNYEEKVKENWINTVKDDDYVLIAGDISWGTYLSESVKDYAFINSLPGKKIIIKGNHDYYYDTKSKMEKFFKDNNFKNFSILQNNAIDLGKVILCGARGWGDSPKGHDFDEKMIRREAIRLELSLIEGIKMQEKIFNETGVKKEILVMMHYPPYDVYEFRSLLEKYKVSKCIYGHLHGFGHSKVFEGNLHGVIYVMVSIDYTGFKVIKLK